LLWAERVAFRETQIYRKKEARKNYENQ